MKVPSSRKNSGTTVMTSAEAEDERGAGIRQAFSRSTWVETWLVTVTKLRRCEMNCCQKISGSIDTRIARPSTVAAPNIGGSSWIS